MDKSNFKILVVDDSNTIRKSAETFLKTGGYDVYLSENGYEALAQVDAVPPDLIFMDIMMPRMDGFQACKLLKSNPNYKDTPVVLLSGKDGIFDKAKGGLVGASDHVGKPFTREEIIEKANHWFALQAGTVSQ